jgi:DeoR/GlpR family transcriptional regulator of sugar metabolism
MPKRGVSFGRRDRLAAIALHIARHPGLHRRELAAHFGVAERQLNDDLKALRQEDTLEVCARVTMAFVRDHGYRYAVTSVDEVWTNTTSSE